MRLIDADSFKKFLTKLYEAGAPYDGIIALLDKQPTAYDVDKVVEQLDTYITKLVGRNSALYQTIIGIVKAGGSDGNTNT